MSTARFQRRLVGLLILVVALPIRMAEAQPATSPTPAELRLQWYDQHVAMNERSLFKNPRWQFLGPTNMSGRSTDIAVVEPRGKSYTLYFAAATGGLWKTDNEGTTWTPAFEHGPSTSIGDVAVAPSDPNIVYVGTGEANIFRSSVAGAGIFKSTDAGATWTYSGLAATHTIARILVHPTNPDIVYAAASGREWTTNPDRGVFKTTDGGRNWQKVLYIDEMTGAIDLVADPRDPNTLYAATWQRVRKKWNDPRNEPNYTGSGIHKTTNGGQSWTQINRGLPEPRHRGRIGIDIARSNPNVLYAFVDNYEVARPPTPGATDAYGRPAGPVIKGATVYRTDDQGGSWRQVSEANQYMERLSATYGWVFGQMRVDPTNENKIYVMGLGLNVSEDGGRTFRQLSGMHGDHHGLWIDPANPNYLVNANDGGIYISYDAGRNWRFQVEVPAVQFFNVAYDMATPFRVYGSIQDHGSRRGIVDLRQGRNNIPAVDFEGAPGGEGSNHAIDPRNPNIVYSAGFYGNISRSDLAAAGGGRRGGGANTNITPQPPQGALPYRGQWMAPFILSPHNPDVVYHGFNVLHRSLDRGANWEKISPDLTYNDTSKLGDIPYQTIFSISESPFQQGLLYVGTDDGRVHLTRDVGKNWTELATNLPRGKFIAELVASKWDEGTVYMAQNGKRDDDFAPYLWKSTDYGTRWTSIVANIPSGPINVIKEDPKNRNVLYVGTDLGVYVTLDGGAAWHSLPAGLPVTFVHDLVVHPRDDVMVAATHGRGMYALDVQPFQQLTTQHMQQAVHVLEPAPLEAGVPSPVFWYWLRSAAPAQISIKDREGRTVRELQGSGNAGLNLAVLQAGGGGRGGGGGRRGGGGPPAALAAGTYTVEVRQGTAAGTANLQVR